MKTIAMVAAENDHVFNDDLLANSGDVEWVRQSSPQLAPVLDFPELREVFAKYDKLAIAARKQTQRWGLLSIGFGVAALLAAATEPLWGGQAWLPRLVGTVTELVGLLGAIVGIGGLWLGPSKRNWLLNRLMTERIRQWYFQFLVYRGDLVRRGFGTTGDDLANFLRTRQLLFGEFLAAHRGKLDSLLTGLTGVNYESEGQIVEESAAANHGYEADKELFNQVVSFYSRLRIRHQLQYAQHKLQASTDKPWRKFLSWPPIVQEKFLTALGSACLSLAILISVGIIVGHSIGFVNPQLAIVTVLEHSSLNSLAVGLAIVSVAVRTVEDGLGVKADVERYQHYANHMAQLSRSINQETSIRNRLKLMVECEQLCFEEMREFMVQHHKATFAL